MRLLAYATAVITVLLAVTAAAAQQDCGRLPSGTYGPIFPCSQQSSTSTVMLSTSTQPESAPADSGATGIGYILFDEFNLIADPLFQKSTRIKLSGKTTKKETGEKAGPVLKSRKPFSPVTTPGLNSSAVIPGTEPASPPKKSDLKYRW